LDRPFGAFAGSKKADWRRHKGHRNALGVNMLEELQRSYDNLKQRANELRSFL